MYKHHRYPKSIILQAVYFKLRFTLSYRDVEELRFVTSKFYCLKFTFLLDCALESDGHYFNAIY